MKNILSIPDNAITADMVGLNPSIPHSAGVNSLKEALENRVNKQILTSDLVKTAELVFCNNYFEFLKFFNKYQEQLQVQSLPLHIHVSICKPGWERRRLHSHMPY